MVSTIQEFFADAKKAGKTFDAFVANYNLTSKVTADHICYKCSAQTIFETIRKMFESESDWIYQAIISKRRIATIRTKQCLETLAGNINLVELSDQKPDGSQTDGFDHIEMYPTSIPYDALVSYLRKQGLDVKEVVRPHHTTHDITLENGFIIRLTRDPLVNKIKKEQQ